MPTESNTVAPDENYMPILKRGSVFSSTNGTIFTLIEDVDFSDSSLERVVAQTDPQTGAPIRYAIRAYGQIISGEIGVETIDVGAYSKFPKLQLQTTDIAEILSIVDSESNRYYEVDHLTQDVIYIPVVNMSENRDTVRNIMKPVSVSRRFTVEKTALNTFLQFGDGTDETEVEYLDPSNVILDTFAKTHTTDTSFDPSMLNKSGKLGVAPANTSLLVTFRLNTSDNVNASANTITTIENAILSFRNADSLAVSQINEVRTSLEALNEEAIVGDISLPTSEEIKIRAYSNFATQNRAVTKQDYVSVVYNMPSKFGAVKRASVSLDTNSYNQRNLEFICYFRRHRK